MQVTEIIRAKRNGEALSKEHLRALVLGYLEGQIPDYQMAAFCMAVFFKGMSAEETAWLTELIWKTGDTFPRESRNDYWVDKHSTGGVGDKTSLILVPLVISVSEALLGKGKIRIPMVSGRGLEHTGGTLDKMASVPGFSSDLSVEKAKSLLHENGFFMMGQTDTIAPADKRLYALRDVTATVESLPLIVASIMGKKLAENINGLVLDVKVGRGAFMQSEAEATRLAAALIQVARAQGVDAMALLSSMDEPLGFCIGNQLEVEECADFLRAERRDEGLYAVTMRLAAWMIHLGSGKSIPLAKAQSACEAHLKQGSAFGWFVRLFEAQGGRWEEFEGERKKLRLELLAEKIRAPKAGYIARLCAREIGLLVNELGGGRVRKEDNVDLKVGVELSRKVGDAVEAGETIATVYYRKARDRATIEERFEKALQIAAGPVAKTEWIRGWIA